MGTCEAVEVVGGEVGVQAFDDFDGGGEFGARDWRGGGRSGGRVGGGFVGLFDGGRGGWSLGFWGFRNLVVGEGDVDFLLVDGEGGDFVEEHGEDAAAGSEVEFWVADGDVDPALECLV